MHTLIYMVQWLSRTLHFNVFLIEYDFRFCLRHSGNFRVLYLYWNICLSLKEIEFVFNTLKSSYIFRWEVIRSKIDEIHFSSISFSKFILNIYDVPEYMNGESEIYRLEVNFYCEVFMFVCCHSCFIPSIHRQKLMLITKASEKMMWIQSL